MLLYNTIMFFFQFRLIIFYVYLGCCINDRFCFFQFLGISIYTFSSENSNTDLLIVFSALIEVQNILVAGTYTLKFMVVDHCGDTGVVTVIVTVTKEVRAFS